MVAEVDFGNMTKYQVFIGYTWDTLVIDVDSGILEYWYLFWENYHKTYITNIPQQAHYVVLPPCLSEFPGAKKTWTRPGPNRPAEDIGGKDFFDLGFVPNWLCHP